MKQYLQSIFTVIAAACLGLGAVPSVQAQSIDLGLDSSLNLLTFGNFFVPSSDVQGRVAVGGNASIANYSINTANGTQALYGGMGLTVAGNLDMASGAIFGNTLVGGNLSTGQGVSFGGSVQVGGNLNANNNWLSASSISYGGSVSGLNPWQSPTPVQVAAGSIQPAINFAAEQQRLSSLSQSFNALTNTGVGVDSWGTLTFDAHGANLAVFDLAAADVSKNLRIDNLGANTSVIFNVHGQTIDFGNHGYGNFAPGHVLFNLTDATQVSFAGGVDASFLAPTASFASTGGLISGQVVVANWAGSAQVNIAPVPEPETYALMLVGLIGVSWGVRRRRTV